MVKKIILAIFFTISIIIITVFACKQVLKKENLTPTTSLNHSVTNQNEIVIDNKKYLLDIIYPDLPGELVNIKEGSNLNVRSSSKTDSDIIFKINNKSNFTIKGKINDWYIIKTNNQLGFASSDYVKLATTTKVIKEETTIDEITYTPHTIVDVTTQNNTTYIVDGENKIHSIDNLLLQDIDELKNSLKIKFQNNEGTLLAKYTTYYTLDDINRNHNMTLACQTINEAIVLPQEEFNWESYIGPADASQGYKEAGVIYNGQSTSGYGGGICQVSSTLYNACLKANLEITERHSHSKPVGYVPLNMDATVSYQTSNYRFINNTNTPLAIRAWTENGSLTVELYQINY